MKFDTEVLLKGDREDIARVFSTLSTDELIDMFKCVAEAGRASAGVVKDIDGGTPSNRCEEKGETDPFADYTAKKRSELPMGDFTDDELANAMFLNYDHVPPVQDMLSGKAKMPIVYMTAGKERMRWLGRQVLELQKQVALLTGNAAPAQEEAILQVTYPITSADSVEVFKPGTGRFKNIILHHLANTPAKEIQLSEPLSSILKRGGGIPRGSFYYISAHTPPEKSRLHTLEGTQHDNSKGSTEGGEGQGD